MLNQRKPISTKTRFDIFKRDSFTCQYCGKGTTNGVVLEVDHIVPVCEGGNNSKENLVTACWDCNRGKGGRELTQVPETLQEKTAKMVEKEAQYKVFKKIQDKTEARLASEIDSIDAIYQEEFPKRELTANFKQTSVRNFIDKLGVLEVQISMRKAVSKCNNGDGAAKYFCGICWNKIKNGADYNPF